MTKTPLLIATLFLGCLTLPAFAQDAAASKTDIKAEAPADMMMDHNMGHADHTPGLYDEAMNKMHKDMMSVKNTGDADADFVAGMIPHHQGAIDMAKIVLEKGKDPEIRALAEGIISAQESEITMMKKWQEMHPAK